MLDIVLQTLITVMIVAGVIFAYICGQSEEYFITSGIQTLKKKFNGNDRLSKAEKTKRKLMRKNLKKLIQDNSDAITELKKAIKEK